MQRQVLPLQLRNKGKTIRGWSAALLIFYSIVLIYWMFFAFGRAEHVSASYRYNLVPLRTIGYYFEPERLFRIIWMINIIGNIVVFVPFGLLMRYAFRWRLAKAGSVFAIGMLLLELLQLVTKRGTFDVDDLLMNLAGFWLGWRVAERIIN
ncbi:VanZ family protein [Paenibacillus curdlanolyticus YK9]|uniref:VanZ family protein n=1 Tax=Paenibacillus curdlanolyticus YK9 TaxID=717606 RepID=E0ICS8_9BACL|nr:VanZ family protein [Paenibacillus curdlanolyticus]EFM09964.1 VanZ family protein [Paenibacillus curdlanolyticus YK9]